MLASLISDLTPAFNWPSEIDVDIDIEVHIKR